MPHVLAFFAHPDDETLSAGALLAHLAARYEVHLVTATRGELGESAPGVLKNPTRAQYVARREKEVRHAAAALGVASYTFLDRFGAGSVTDSGMKWADHTHTRAIADPEADPVTAFSLGELENQAQALARAIDYYRPELLITEEPGGGYGHPDHIRCHQVAKRALSLATHPVKFLSWAAIEAQSVRDDLATMAESGLEPVIDPAGPLPSQMQPAEKLDVVLDGSPYRGRVLAALRAHATQVPATGRIGNTTWYTLTDGVKRAVPKRVGLILDDPAQDSVTRTEHIEEFTQFVQAPVRVPPRWYRIAMLIISVLFGLIIGALGTASHRSVPGLVIALVAVLAGGVLSRSLAGWGGTFGFWSANAAVILILTYIRPGSDVLVTTDWLSTTWLLAGIFLGSVGFAVPQKWLRE